MTAGERCQPICGRGRVEADGSRARESQHLLRAEERRGTELQPLPGVSRGAPTRDTRHSAVGPTQGVYILMVMRCLLRGQDAGTQVCPSISGYSPPVCALHKGARLTGNWELNPVLALLLKPFPGERGKRCTCQFGHMPMGGVCPRGVPILKSSTQRECPFETA